MSTLVRLVAAPGIGSGADFFTRWVREEFRFGSNLIKIMASGGFATPNDLPDQPQMSEEEVRAVITDRLLSMLGRNSLPVFCVGSLLSLAGQIVRFVYEGYVSVDTVVVVVGVSVMALTAWFAEWRDRARTKVPADLPARS